MNDETTPMTRPDCTMHVDVSHGGDIAIDLCEEAIAALLLRRRPESLSADASMPELVNEEIPLIGDDPDRPAA